MTPTEFRDLVADAFGQLCKTYSLQMPSEKGFILRLDGPEVFVGVSYDAFRSQEVAVDIGLKKGLAHPVERPFELAEVLRAVGHYELPDARREATASHAEVGRELARLAQVLATYAHEALRGDRSLYARLDAQRDLDCYRYQYARPLDVAGRAACEAWADGKYGEVVVHLRPFEAKLTENEKSMLREAEERLRRG